MATSSDSGLPQQSPLSAIPGFDPTTAFGSDGSSGSSFGGSNIDISSLPYGGNPFAGDNLFTIFNSGGVDPLTVGDPYASSGSSGISTTAASGGTPVASVGGTTTGTSDSTSTPVASDSTSTTVTTSGSNPVASVGGTTTGTSDSTSTTVASDSTSTTAGASDSTSLLQNSPLAQIPDFDPTTISVDDNPFTALATVFPNLDLSSYIGGSTATTGDSTSTTVTTSGSNPVASVSSTTTGTSDSTSTTGTSDSSSLLQQSPLAAIPGFDPSSISIGGNPFTGVSNTPTASDSTSTTPVSDSNQQSPFDLASAVLGNNSPFTSSSDLSSFLLNVFGQGGSPLDSNNQAIIFDGSSNPFASIGNSLANGTNPFANGGNPFAGITDNPYASGTASITAQNAPVGQFNTDVGSNNATIGNGDWNFGNDNATIGNGNWLLNFSSNNTTLGNGNWYRNSSNNNETLGNGNWDFGSNDATIGNGNWDFGTNNTVIGNGNWIFTSNTTVIGNGNLLSPSGNSSSVGTFVPGLETSVDSLISSLVGNFGQDFVELTGNLDSADLQTLDQLILSKAGNNLLAQKPQPVPEPGFSADIAVLGIALLLWLSFKKWFPLQKLAFRMSK